MADGNFYPVSDLGWTDDGLTFPLYQVVAKNTWMFMRFVQLVLNIREKRILH